MSKITAGGLAYWLSGGERYGHMVSEPNKQAAALAERDAEIERLRAEALWKPIDTAPKDGTKILLGKIVGHPAHETALWWAVRGFWSSKWHNWNDGVEPCGLAGPTHWRHLSTEGAEP